MKRFTFSRHDIPYIDIVSTILGCLIAMKKWLILLLLIGVFPYSSVYAEGPNECIELDGNTFNNVCQNKVTVRWVDEGYCAADPGCAVYIPAYGKYKIKSVTGKLRYATCIYPKVASGDWQSTDKYTCK